MYWESWMAIHLWIGYPYAVQTDKKNGERDTVEVAKEGKVYLPSLTDYRVLIIQVCMCVKMERKKEKIKLKLCLRSRAPHGDEWWAARRRALPDAGVRLASVWHVVRTDSSVITVEEPESERKKKKKK